MADPTAESVRTRLLNRARSTGEDYNQLLIRYAGIRFLVRLAQSPHASSFILKGATLFLIWDDGAIHRPTKDIDLLGFLQADAELLRGVMGDICRQPVVPADGMVYDGQSVRVDAIREGTNYGGLRCRVESTLGTARLPLQIDVGFGDAVTPGPIEVHLPRLLADEVVQPIRAYTPETVVAEKLEAIVRLGLANSRMKDYLDLDLLLSDYNLDPENLRSAIARTFARRRTEIPESLPNGLTDSFWTDELATRRWDAYVLRAGLRKEPLEAVCRRIGNRLQPVIQDLSSANATTDDSSRG